MTPRKLLPLSDAVRSRAMRLSRFDAVVYALMVGLGEAYILADAVRLGASASEIALLVGLPLALGASGPILALRLLRKLGCRKPVVIGAATGQGLLLFLLSALDASGLTTAWTLIGVSVLYQVCAQCAGTAWSSWYGDLVPEAVRGRYFATRNRGAYAGTLVGLVASGLILNELEPARAGVASAGGGMGFAVAYFLAGVCRLASVGFLSASREGRFAGMPNRARVARFLNTERGSGVWRLVLLVGLLQVTVFIASPFFNPYMLEQLEFSYIEYMSASACVVVVKVLVLPLWGRLIDRQGARRTLAPGAILVAFIPFPWIFTDELWTVLLCQALSGLAWSGFEVGHFSLLLELGYRRMRPTVFAAQSVVSGSAQLVGGLIGGVLLVNAYDPNTVFVLSGCLRMGVVALLLGLLPKSSGATRGERLQLRVTGFRVGTGLTQRPVEEADARPERSQRVGAG